MWYASLHSREIRLVALIVVQTSWSACRDNQVTFEDQRGSIFGNVSPIILLVTPRSQALFQAFTRALSESSSKQQSVCLDQTTAEKPVQQHHELLDSLR